MWLAVFYMNFEIFYVDKAAWGKSDIPVNAVVNVAVVLIKFLRPELFFVCSRKNCFLKVKTNCISVHKTNIALLQDQRPILFIHNTTRNERIILSANEVSLPFDTKN